MKLTHIALAGLALLLAAGVYLTLKTDMEGQMSDLKTTNEKQWLQFQQSMKEMADAQKAAADLAAAKEKAAAEAAKKPAENAVPKGEEVAALPIRGRTPDSIRATPGEAAIQDTPPNLDGSDPVAARIEREEQNILNSSGAGVDRIALETAAAAARDLNAEKPLKPLQSIIASQPAIARIKQAETSNADFVVIDAGLNAKLMRGDRFAIRRGTAIIAKVSIGSTVEPTQSIAVIEPGSLVPGMALENGDELIKYDR
jgi:hypothetical protein